MKIKWLSYLSALALLCVLASCSKEYSAENVIGSGYFGTNSGTAIYTFSGGTTNCITPVKSGIYAPGTATTSANTVALQVTVSTAGSYVISTAIINGISFSASGTFTATGVQTLLLTASGTPTNAGIFNYIPGTNGCSFTITFTSPQPVKDGTITCKIDGVFKTFNYMAMGADSTTPAVPPVPIILTLEIYGNVSATSNEFIYLALDKFSSPIVNGDLFDQSTLISGRAFFVDYTDANNLYYSAYSALSGGTPFTITVTSKTTTRAQGTFSGTLIETGSSGGTVKNITEGKFDVPIQ